MLYFLLCLAIGCATAAAAILFIHYRLWPLLWTAIAAAVLAVVGQVVLWALYDKTLAPWWA